MNEILQNPAQEPVSAEGLHDSLGEFLKGDTEEWKKKWQDPNFTYVFPARVQNFLFQDGHTQFLKEHGEEVIRTAVSTFMVLPWNPREKGCIALDGMVFTQNGEVMPLETKRLTSHERPAVDSLMKAEIASILLLGFSPSNKEYTKDFIVKSYQELTTNRKDTFRNNTFRLITDSSNVREWIRTNNLDVQNSFSWDQDVARLALSLAPPRHKSSEGLRALPNELLYLEQFPAGIIEVSVDYVLNYVKSLHTITLNRKDIPRFIFEVERRPDKSRYEEKLGQLKELSKPR